MTPMENIVATLVIIALLILGLFVESAHSRWVKAQQKRKDNLHEKQG